MRWRVSYAVCGLVLAMAGCDSDGGQGPSEHAGPKVAEADLSSPEATFETLTRAIGSKDLALYERCFSKAAMESGEAGLDRFERDAEGSWRTLQGAFQGPQDLRVGRERDGVVSARVEAPEAEHGGIGSISFEREGDDWKVRTW